MCKYKDEKWLRKKYIEEDLLQQEIAELCDVEYHTISRWLERFGIPKRAKGMKIDKELETRILNAVKEHESELPTKREIARLVDNNPATTHRYLDRLKNEGKVDYHKLSDTTFIVQSG